jgi:hypothetical protein
MSAVGAFQVTEDARGRSLGEVLGDASQVVDPV